MQVMECMLAAKAIPSDVLSLVLLVLDKLMVTSQALRLSQVVHGIMSSVPKAVRHYRYMWMGLAKRMMGLVR